MRHFWTSSVTKICNIIFCNVIAKQFILFTHCVVFMSNNFTKAIDLIITVQKHYKIQELKKYILYLSNHNNIHRISARLEYQDKKLNLKIINSIKLNT